MIVPLPKKGDLSDCNNWQGITLLSFSGKVFACVLLVRIQKAVDTNLRQEQAGFRPGRSCNDQIFALRQIIEKVTALQKTSDGKFHRLQESLRLHTSTITVGNPATLWNPRRNRDHHPEFVQDSKSRPFATHAIYDKWHEWRMV